MGRKTRRPKSHKKGKPKADDSHIRRRLSERYGITVNTGDLEAAIDDIRLGRSFALPYFPGESRSRHTHIVGIKGIKVAVVYSKAREGTAALITALPPDSTQIPYRIRTQLGKKIDDSQ